MDQFDPEQLASTNTVNRYLGPVNAKADFWPNIEFLHMQTELLVIKSEIYNNTSQRF